MTTLQDDSTLAILAKLQDDSTLAILATLHTGYISLLYRSGGLAVGLAVFILNESHLIP